VNPVLLPLSELPRARQLLSAPALAQLLARVGACRLIEVGSGARDDFAAAHIPGACWLDTASFETPPLYNKVADSALLALLLELGIDAATTVVVYGRSSLAAARAAHLMLYAGVRDVRLLDGGFGAWCAAGLPCARGAGHVPAPAPAFGAPFPGRPDYLLDTAATAALLASEGTALASIRTWGEYTGATSGYCYIAARGEIAGACWGRAGAEGDVDSMSDYQLADGRMRPPEQIARMWAAGGIHPGLRVGFYCGTGWRASLAFFYAWLMGWERIAVYDGGWFEWSSDSANPVVCRAAEPMRA
jgi:thiosulfate/3-mercaptopyruvate sulfurtransferase